MSLTAIFGLALLLVGPKPTGAPAAILVLQAQETTSEQSPPEHKPPQDQSSPEHGESGAATPTGSDSNSHPQPAAAPAKNTKAKPGSPRKRKPSGSATKPNQPADKTPAIVVVRNGGTSERQGQIASGITVQQAPQQMKETNSLLNATTFDLEKISGKELNPNQQGMVKQIRDYMQQSKSAARAGDVQGANNLAFKAHLLSQELVKH